MRIILKKYKELIKTTLLSVSNFHQYECKKHMNRALGFCLFLLCFVITNLSSQEHQSSKKLLIGSCVDQNPRILNQFLGSLSSQNTESYSPTYLFITDKDDGETDELLSRFIHRQNNGSLIVNGNSISSEKSRYVQLGKYKDYIIAYALQHGFDALFLIDTQIILQPQTIEYLFATNKEIVSEIFWTRWGPDSPIVPQVWLTDQYTQYEKGIEETLTSDEVERRQRAFFDRLQQPGTYEVGGLGACTLIQRSALEKGVRFERIPNISYLGEDRHFCIRSAVLGVPLYVDTHYPAFYFNGQNEDALRAFLHNPNTARRPHRLTLSMIVKNEADRYLKQVLEAAKEYITDAVIIDDASTDNTVQVCKEVLSGIPLTLISNNSSLFSNEVFLRKQQWEETVKTNPEWILVLDGDEIFEPRFRDEVHNLLSQKDVDAFYFRLYDMWDETHYRNDTEWQAHYTYRPFLIRYRPEITYEWLNRAQHCGRFPLNIHNFSYQCSPLRLKHYGWARKEDRIEKYKRYMELDPQGTCGSLSQYQSILDENPTLIPWSDTEN